MTKSPNAVAITRRSVIAGFACAGVGAGAKAGPRSLERTVAGAPDLSKASAAEWRALVGQRFTVAGMAGAPMNLVAVEPAQSGGRRPGHVRRRQAFAAIFETSAASAPEGGNTYWLAHRSVAPLPVHFATTGEVAGKTRLVAIFN